ncbi:tubulin polymerization-promoting protein family member 2-like isoform X2 [Hydractinia symbiolongicarpus]|uniref:tubulin polymerization-promoting protein family member 2-like isoform X2 n=1 Tax=Hydractinia symbiolongicarpus TaxID=13093 RepID=UPI00254BFF7F|nr:tubulin polymerization-promoting protein family member 2-like isoform X2 [Hydractinia symbiolongicarpus]
MEDVFKSFCAFGAGKNDVALMDGSKFAKFARDMKLLDKKLTATDVDIIFNRTEVKPKAERKIKFQQFQVALKLLAEKKYGSADEVPKLEEKILASKGPKKAGATKTVKSGAVDRLTDTSKYTGSHKERFDESGKGKGLEGRVNVAANDGYVGAYKEKGSYDKTH